MMMKSFFFRAFVLAVLVSPASGASADDCVPGKTPVQCNLSPSPMEFDQCKMNRTPILCGLFPLEQETRCPAVRLEDVEYRRVGCFERGGIKLSVYAKKETQISGFDPISVVDFDYAYVFVGESHSAAELAEASGFAWKSGKIVSFSGTSLAQIAEKELLLKRVPNSKVRKEQEWWIGDENLNYMGPGDGIDIDCSTALRWSHDRDGASVAVQTCLSSHDTEGWRSFRSWLNRLK